MAEYLTMRFAIRLFTIAFVLLAHSAQAESLKDPTQPPASLDINTSSNAGLQAHSGPVLQSIMIGAQFRAAIINGKKVFLGKKYEEATLIKLNDHEAVLRNPDGTTQTLTTSYGVEKKVLSQSELMPKARFATKNTLKHSSKIE